jgi:hypothetical protein
MLPNARVPDGVDAAVDPMESRVENPAVDSGARQPELEQLGARDDTMLSPGQRRDLALDLAPRRRRGGFAPRTTHMSTRLSHAAVFEPSDRHG